MTIPTLGVVTMIGLFYNARHDGSTALVPHIPLVSMRPSVSSPFFDHPPLPSSCLLILFSLFPSPFLLFLPFSFPSLFFFPSFLFYFSFSPFLFDGFEFVGCPDYPILRFLLPGDCLALTCLPPCHAGSSRNVTSGDVVGSRTLRTHFWSGAHHIDGLLETGHCAVMDKLAGWAQPDHNQLKNPF